MRHLHEATAHRVNDWGFGKRTQTLLDSEARPIPGVTVAATSPMLIGGSRTTYTNQSGFYRFPVLPPGTYEVKAELSGFQTDSRKDIVLSIITTLTVDFTLQLLRTSEVIEVSGDRPPLIDSTTTAVSVQIPPEIVSNLPRSQDIQYMIAMTPGVTDDLVAFGSPSSENSFWVDGVNMSNPRDGGKLLLKYDQNWIDQVQVSGIGAPAEYGGFTGVVANFVTRSGSNHFHGLFETFFQNQDMVGSNWPNPHEDRVLAQEIYELHLDAPLEKSEPDENTILDVAFDYSATAYDAVYISLCLTKAVPLITAEKTTRPWVTKLKDHIELVR